jgi:CDP-diacylglycerol--serine O-phosphatidyltransferase
VLTVIVAAGIVAYPFLALTLAMLLYLGHVPYAAYRYRWLAAHPEAWGVEARQRRAIRRSGRRLGLRPPPLRRVAGAAARASARVRGRRGGGSGAGGGGAAGTQQSRRRLGLRRPRRW